MNQRNPPPLGRATVVAVLLSGLVTTFAGAPPAIAKADPPTPRATGGVTVPGNGGSMRAGATGGSSAFAAGAPAGYTVTGIDVSSWQGNVDWTKVAAAGTKFAYVKATEGTTYVNPYFNGQYNGAKQAGLYAGAYVFARPDSPNSVAQADFFIDNAQFANDGKTLPVMLDVEWPYNNSSGTPIAPSPCWGISTSAMVSWIRSFVTRVQQRTGKQTLIYTAKSWWDECTGGNTSFGDQLLDVASWGSTPPSSLPTSWSNWTFWQWAGDGMSAGTGLPGGQDVFNGTLADLDSLAKSSAPSLAVNGPAFITNPDSSRLKGDFNGDGRDDLAMYYYYGAGQASIWTMTGRADGGFDPPVNRWLNRYWGNGTRFLTAGDFNADGKSDIGLWYDFGNGRVSLLTLTANASGDGGFSAPVARWNAPFWGGGSRFIATGDYNGDGKSDVALWYDFGGGHVSLFTFSANANGDGGFADPVARWDAPYWGGGTRFVSGGDYNGDGKSDVALFYHYGGTSVALFTLTANATGDGGFGGPITRWSAPSWGSGTKFLGAGNYTSDAKNDIALWYDYGGGRVSLFTLAANASGDGGLGTPTRIWDGPYWGVGTRFLVSDGVAGARDGISLWYDYGGGSQAVFRLAPDTANGYYGPAQKWSNSVWGGGTQALF